MQTVGKHAKQTKMTNSEWLNHLCDQQILTQGELEGQTVLHLQTPCEINLTETATKTLQVNYDPGREKGGLFAAYPDKKDGKTILTIKEIIYLTNVADDPEHSYLPNNKELANGLKRAFKEHFLPIRFHTHPTEDKNPIMEIFNYLFQADTSEQDRLVSNTVIPVGDKRLLLPRSLVLGTGKSNLRMFIGFYNGLIAPIEFDSHKKDIIKKAMDKILDDISEWAKKGDNKWWLIGGGVLLALLTIRYNKYAIPLILMLVAMAPMFANDQSGRPKYFAQLTKAGQITINIP